MMPGSLGGRGGTPARTTHAVAADAAGAAVTGPRTVALTGVPLGVLGVWGLPMLNRRAHALAGPTYPYGDDSDVISLPAQLRKPLHFVQ